jgi:hypothetical protein
MPKTKVTYVMQYEGRGPDDWIDASARDTPEEAFERLDAFRASWNYRMRRRPDDTPGFQVVRREVTDTVIEDPRPAGDTAEEVA